jgi:hypothetical protein
VAKPFATTLKIRLSHSIGLFHAVNKFGSCCKWIPSGGLGTGEILKEREGHWNLGESNFVKLLSG